MNVARHPWARRQQIGKRRLMLFLATMIGFVIFKIAGTGPDDLSRAQIVFALLSIGLIFAAIGVYVRQGSAVIGGRAPELAVVNDPPVSRLLFSSVSSAPIWLVIRLYVGYEWMSAGLDKVTASAWQDGSALQGFWTRIVQVPEEGSGSAPITYGWYRQFIQFMLDNGWHSWFGPLVAWGELLVGIALILGAFTGIAAFFGALMNFNYMLAGSASTNPVLFFLAILLILGWKVAGHFGLDRFLLPRLGTLWTPGTFFHNAATTPERPRSNAHGARPQSPQSQQASWLVKN